MCDTTFTFGQRGSHFFQCPSRRDHTRLPKKLATLLSSTQIALVHHVTLGFEESFLLTWRDKLGRDRIESRGLPEELTEFLYAKNAQGHLLRNIAELRLTLGPYNSSFLVHDGSAYLWNNLPSKLFSALQDRIKSGSWIDRPRLVTLGADSNFLLITEHDAAIWDLDCYAAASKMLEYSRTQAQGIADVKTVTLHAYRYQCFIAQSTNGTLISENIPHHELPGVKAIGIEIMRNMEKTVKRSKQAGGKVQAHRSTPQRTTSQSSNARRTAPQRNNIQRQATLRTEWGGEKQEFRAQAKGLRLSLTLSVSAAGLVGNIGKMLG